jgi:cell division protease FtsH
MPDSGTKPAPTPPGPPDKGPVWSRPQWINVVWYVLLALAMLWFWQEQVHPGVLRTIPYSEFKERLAEGQVVSCSVAPDEIDGTINLQRTLPSPAVPATLSAISHPAASVPAASQPAIATASTPASSGASPKAAADDTFDFRTIRIDDPNLVHDLEVGGAAFTGVKPSFLSSFIWSWILPIGLVWLIWWFLSRRMRGVGQSILGIGSSKARLVADTETGVTFDDVAGCDEAKFELSEVVSFLKNPAHYKALGAQIPKGVLLVGPPGTGKTLLARACAGEAHVPFFSISGSEFVEMFVGVGAARVRDLFEKAKTKAPCIVFIDELDAVGRQRGVQMGMVNDEREQTLNQLLVGMDGFEVNAGVVVLAATNRPEVLDRALLRPGRFDRQVVVDAPDTTGRLAILRLHARGKPLDPGVNMQRIAQETPGFSGADLANVINEAALLAARRNAHTIQQEDLQTAVEKVVAGPERKSRRLSPEDKRRVAYHETGHALVAAYCKHADTLHKISVVPNGRAALGYTLQLPEQDRYLMSASQLTDRIKGLLGGRAAEEIVFGEVSTGPENDLEHATALARQMVCVYGMSQTVGLAHLARPEHLFLPNVPDARVQSNCSEQTAREVDQEVKRMLDDAYQQAKTILTAHRDQLDLIADYLLEHETMDAATFKELLGRPDNP